MSKSITEQELTAARQIWADALLAISKAFEEDGIEAATAEANKALDAAYGYELGTVLFKPTLAGGEKTFRPTREGALSYFVGHNEDYPLDAGFGIRPWCSVEFHTAGTLLEGELAIWMGWAEFTDKDGNVIRADKSWGYRKDEEGNLKIVLHHSSLPFQAD